MQNKNQVVIYGRHAVFAALANPRRNIVRIVCLKENAAELRGRIGEKKLSVVERRELEKMLPREAVHQGMAAVAEMLGNIAKAKSEGAQLTLVYMHWGIERDYTPQESDMRVARQAIDAGADLVVGSHPHVVQGWEVYQGRYIVYSLGNFCFGGNTNPDDKDCLIFQQTFTVTGDTVAKNDDVDFIAASVSTETDRNTYQPILAEGDEKARIEAKVQEAADRIAAAA